MDLLSEAAASGEALINGLESNQTILQLFLFRSCTANKLTTHLFASDVLNHDAFRLPREDNWDMWESDMTDEFSRLIGDVIFTITNQVSLPDHVLHISTMATSQGGLGINHPRTSAIPTLILTLKRSI